MTGAELAIAAVLVAALSARGKRRVMPSSANAKPAPGLLDIIRARARQHNVKLPVALAFADVETRFNPKAVGDLDWPTRKDGELYRKHVLGNPALQHNPYRSAQSMWHSYGLYQLLAPYHVHGTEDPRILLDPDVNADRALRAIGALLARHHDPMSARLAYIGCGPDGSLCSAERVQLARTRFLYALGKWEQAGVS